jgi:hypothetical protein
MDSGTIALEMPTHVDVDAPRRELVAFLSLATITAWALAAVTTMQALII